MLFWSVQVFPEPVSWASARAACASSRRGGYLRLLGVKLREAGDLGLVFLLIRRAFDHGVEGLGRHVDRVRGGVVGEAEVRNVLVKLGHHFGDCGLLGGGFFLYLEEGLQGVHRRGGRGLFLGHRVGEFLIGRLCFLERLGKGPRLLVCIIQGEDKGSDSGHEGSYPRRHQKSRICRHYGVKYALRHGGNIRGVGREGYSRRECRSRPLSP